MLWWLAETTMMAAILAVVAALIGRRLRPRPAVMHALWLVVLLRLLAPPLFAWPWPASVPQPIVAEPPRPPPSEPPREELPAQPPLEVIVLAPPIVPIDDPATPPEIEPAPVAETPASAPAALEGPSPPAPPGWPQRAASLLVAVWIGGAGLMALLQMVRIVRFRRRVSRGQPAPPSLVARVSDVAARLGVRPPPIVVVPDLASPMVWSFGRPRLLWPAVLLGQLPPDGEQAAIAHELAHLHGAITGSAGCC